MLRETQQVSPKKRARKSVNIYPCLKVSQPYRRTWVNLRICLTSWTYLWIYRAISGLRTPGAQKEKAEIDVGRDQRQPRGHPTTCAKWYMRGWPSAWNECPSWKSLLLTMNQSRPMIAGWRGGREPCSSQVSSEPPIPGCLHKVTWPHEVVYMVEGWSLVMAFHTVWLQQKNARSSGEMMRKSFNTAMPSCAVPLSKGGLRITLVRRNHPWPWLPTKQQQSQALRPVPVSTRGFAQTSLIIQKRSTYAPIVWWK